MVLNVFFLDSEIITLNFTSKLSQFMGKVNMEEYIKFVLFAPNEKLWTIFLVQVPKKMFVLGIPWHINFVMASQASLKIK